MPVLSREFLLHIATEHNLSPKQAEVFLLRFADDESSSAIQKRLKLSADAYSQLMSQVYRRFSIEGKTRGKESQLLSFLISKSKEMGAAIAESSPISIDNWQQVCKRMLEAQNQRSLTTNPFTAGEGVTFELKDIYVPIKLVDRKRQPRRRDDVLPEQGSRLYEPDVPEKNTLTFQNNEFFEQVLRRGDSPKSQGRRIAIVGPPGSGKTTWLQKLVDWVFQSSEQDIVIWITLADLQGRTLEEYLLQKWLRDALAVVHVVPEMEEALAGQFKQGRVWLLLDGVDEMDAGMVNPLGVIATQLTGWVAQARVVLTCRLNIWDAGKNVLQDFDVYRNLDFSLDQLEQFVDQWFINQHQSHLGERLRAELKQPGLERIRDAVKNPLRLALLCRTWQQRSGSFPNTKAALYQQFAEALYEWKQEIFPTTSKQRQELNRVLGQLALQALEQKESRFRLRYSLIRRELGESDAPLFQQAIQIGWLNQVGVAEEDPDEKVYAFFHPTFQEYFAALAIEDWHFFLNHVMHNRAESVYRIFEPQWKEVILLWLGQEEVEREQKEQFIKALVKFGDDLQDSEQRERLYFLAAVCIGEFPDSSYADFVLAQIVKWGFFGDFNEKAIAALQETDRTRALTALIELVRAYRDDNTCWLATQSLGEIGAGDLKAMIALTQLLDSSHSDYTRCQAAISLGQIDPGNQDAIDVLIELLDDSQDNEVRWLSVLHLGQIGNENQKELATLTKLLHTTQEPSLLSSAAKSLEQIDPGNLSARSVLTELQSQSQNKLNKISYQQATKSISTNVKQDTFDSLIGLVQEAQRHPVRSKERQRALVKLISVIQKSDQLHSQKTVSPEVYAEALQELWLYVCINIDNYDPRKVPFITWINFLLNHRFLPSVKDIKYDNSESLCLDAPLKNIEYNKTYKRLLDYVAEIIPQEDNDKKNMLDDIIQWIEEDPEGIFESKYISQHREANFRQILIRRNLGNSWQKISQDLGVRLPTLTSFYYHCIKELAPKLREYLQQ